CSRSSGLHHEESDDRSVCCCCCCCCGPRGGDRRTISRPPAGEGRCTATSFVTFAGFSEEAAAAAATAAPRVPNAEPRRRRGSRSFPGSHEPARDRRGQRSWYVRSSSGARGQPARRRRPPPDRKSTRLNSSHVK